MTTEEGKPRWAALEAQLNQPAQPERLARAWYQAFSDSYSGNILPRQQHMWKTVPGDVGALWSVGLPSPKRR